MLSPTAVPPGSRVTVWEMPRSLSKSESFEICVVFPQPSTPSKLTNSPGFMGGCARGESRQEGIRATGTHYSVPSVPGSCGSQSSSWWPESLVPIGRRLSVVVQVYMSDSTGANSPANRLSVRLDGRGTVPEPPYPPGHC